MGGGGCWGAAEREGYQRVWGWRVVRGGVWLGKKDGGGERTSWGTRVGRANMVGRCRWILFLASMAPGSSKLYERLQGEN